MFIPVPIGSFNTAVKAALDASKQKLKEDKAAFAEKSFQALHDGAVHNGLKPSEKDIQDMHDMVARDTAHALKRHPAVETIEYFETLQRAVKYADKAMGDDVPVDMVTFTLLEKYLPEKE